MNEARPLILQLFGAAGIAQNSIGCVPAHQVSWHDERPARRVDPLLVRPLCLSLVAETTGSQDFDYEAAGSGRLYPRSKSYANPCLLHHGVSGVARQGTSVHREGALGYRAIPYLVVTLPLPAILAARGFQGLYDLSVEALNH